MLPFILAGGAVVGAVVSAFAIFKPKCEVCKSPLTINKECYACGVKICGSCGTDTSNELYFGFPVLKSGRRYCKAHSKNIETEVNSLKAEIDAARQVKIYSKNFQGKTESPKLSKVIETNFHDNKDVAELELQMLAVKEGCVVVQKVEFIRDTESSGNYKKAIWKAKGII